jgi:hypothetical protein
MRLIHWLFVVSVLLFLSGIGFIIASARAVRAAPVAQAPLTMPVASVKQIMKAIVGPAAGKVFGAVGTTVTRAGTEEKAPRNDQEWEDVGNSAAALVESGNLMLMGSRVVDKGEWVKMSQALIDASKVSLEATRTKNAQLLLDSGEALYLSCDNCHRKYQRGS